MDDDLGHMNMAISTQIPIKMITAVISPQYIRKCRLMNILKIRCLKGTSECKHFHEHSSVFHLQPGHIISYRSLLFFHTCTKTHTHTPRLGCHSDVDRYYTLIKANSTYSASPLPCTDVYSYPKCTTTNIATH